MTDQRPKPPPVVLPWASTVFDRPPQNPAAVVPLDGPPRVPESDRAPLNLEALVASSVALDVLATETKSVHEHPAILSDVVQAALHVATQSGATFDGTSALIALAAGEVGESREALWRRGAVERPAFTESEPAAVASALRRLESGTETLIREACLLLDAAAATDYRSV